MPLVKQDFDGVFSLTVFMKYIRVMYTVKKSLSLQALLCGYHRSIYFHCFALCVLVTLFEKQMLNKKLGVIVL